MVEKEQIKSSMLDIKTKKSDVNLLMISEVSLLKDD